MDPIESLINSKPGQSPRCVHFNLHFWIHCCIVKQNMYFGTHSVNIEGVPIIQKFVGIILIYPNK